MLFKTTWMDTLFPGKLTTEHSSSSYGRPVIVNQADLAFGVAEVEFVIPDDEIQAEKVRLNHEGTQVPAIPGAFCSLNYASCPCRGVAVGNSGRSSCHGPQRLFHRESR